MIPSDQSERIKQAKVTYYHLGKTIEKDKRSRRKKMKILEEHGKQLVNYSDEIKSLTHSKQKVSRILTSKQMI